MRFKKSNQGGCDFASVFAHDSCGRTEATFTLDLRYNYAFVVAPNDCVALPIAHGCSALNTRRPVLNSDPVRDTAPFSAA